MNTGSVTPTTANAAFRDLLATPRMPTLFVGHGSPMNAITDNAYSREWYKIGETLPTMSTPFSRSGFNSCASA